NQMIHAGCQAICSNRQKLIAYTEEQRNFSGRYLLARRKNAMPIDFNPNDPQAGSTAPAMRGKTPRANQPTPKSGFTFTDTSQEGKFNPDTPQFLFWQCREAALAAVETWESVAGPHTRWQGNRKKLPLRQDAGQDLNAFYDGTSFSFFHQAVG